MILEAEQQLRQPPQSISSTCINITITTKHLNASTEATRTPTSLLLDIAVQPAFNRKKKIRKQHQNCIELQSSVNPLNNVPNIPVPKSPQGRSPVAVVNLNGVNREFSGAWNLVYVDQDVSHV